MRREDLPYAALALGALTLGLFARLHGAGTWPVSYDEYFTGKAVRAILEGGLPRMAAGGYYVRGILLQYLMALARTAGLGEELSLRVVTIAFNCAGLPALFLLARKVAGFRAACLAAAAFCLSSWEIEFSRFARMYAPFQALFLWFLWFLRGLVVEKRERCRLWLWLLAFVGIFVHEGAVFLVALLFLPPILARERPRARDLVVPALLLAAAFLFNSYDFRGAREATAGPGADVVRAGTGKIVMPWILGMDALSRGRWLLPLVALLAVNGFAVSRAARDTQLSTAAKLFLSAALGFCVLNCFAAAAVLLGGALLAGWIGRGDFAWDRSRLVAACAMADLVFWGAYLATLPAIAKGLERVGPVQALALGLLSWPDVLQRVIVLWAGVLPWLCLMTALLLVSGRWTRTDAAPEQGAERRLLALAALVVCAMVGVLRTPYLSTRYSFMILPLVYLADAQALGDLARRVRKDGWPSHALHLGLFLAFLLLSGDVRAGQLFRASSPEVNFRMGYGWYELHHYIPRFDYRTPAKFVNANRQGDDLVVATLVQADFYLRRPMDFFYINSKEKEFRNYAAAGRTRERWTGAGLLSEEDALHAMLRGGERTVWLIAGSPSYPFNRALYASIAARYGAARVYRSLDGAIDVYRIR